MRIRLTVAVAGLALVARGAEPVKLTVDATDAPRRIFHSTLQIPAEPGPLTLVYPKWIPGEHAPTGPIVEVAGLHITAGGKDLAWRRDLDEMCAVNCEVPAGAHAVTVTFDYMSPADTEGFTNSPSSTPRLAVIDWHLFLMYPKGKPAAEQIFEAELRAPAGWRGGGSLAKSSADGSTMRFKPTSLEMLVDHPVVIGAHYRDIDLTPGSKPEHHIDAVADSAAALEITEQNIAPYRNLIAEAAALMGARHYNSYHFLVTLSDNVSSFGLEHHECSDDRMPEDAWTSDDVRKYNGSLMTHEYFHSWNGKHRRPAGLATPDFLAPMRDDLLWVYEGMTEYYGEVLAARSGAWTAADYREYIAHVAARLDHQEGRTWRPLRDTCDAASLLYGSRGAWADHRRGVDFYDEGELIWLEVDAMIREKTRGAKSLDDFCRAFHAPGATLSGTTPTVQPYDAAEVYATLNSVAAFDWKSHLESRLGSKSPHAPLGGIEACGWKLVYSDTPNWFGAQGKGLNLSNSLGLEVDEAGKISDVTIGMSAAAAGLAPGMKIVSVNGRKYSKDRLEQAVMLAHGSREPIEFIIENSEFFSVLKVAYHGGARYPHLERVEGTPDLMTAIVTPRAK